MSDTVLHGDCLEVLKSLPSDRPEREQVDRVINGDCLEVLRTLPDNSFDAIVTDPP